MLGLGSSLPTQTSLSGIKTELIENPSSHCIHAVSNIENWIQVSINPLNLWSSLNPLLIHTEYKSEHGQFIFGAVYDYL